MLSRNRSAIVNKISGLCCVVTQTFWTIFYFFYFLFKGRPDWKCETLPATPKNCCVEAKPAQLPPAKFIHQSSSVRPEPPRAYRGKTLAQKFTEKLQSFTTVATDYSRRIGRFFQKIARTGLQAVQTVLLYLWAILKALFCTNVPSKTLPATPKPFSAKTSDSGSFSKVEFNANELNTVYETEKINNSDSEPQKESDHSSMQLPPYHANVIISMRINCLRKELSHKRCLEKIPIIANHCLRTTLATFNSRKSISLMTVMIQFTVEQALI
ncbi:hypothetical protein KIN20_034467 [Parelaphostrongylus tenuis]|uniref:Uncharacterized protein n=1 Tax=Parelaphostrongylus tenuis TaxID=148309 RepID=A0AAD5WJ07_PARTN|nr:hypothetical protein KIN20_034467 [Parelaphostrongylus tenuis]